MENVINGFGLNEHQTNLLYNWQIRKAKADYQATKKIEEWTLKKQWVDLWVKSLKDAHLLQEVYNTLDDLHEATKAEIEKNQNNLTWYHIMVIECELFAPYFPMDSNFDKSFKKLKYKQSAFTKAMTKEHGVVAEDFVDRIIKQYKKTLNKLDKKMLKIALPVVTTIALTAITFGVATYFAPSIAVALFGSQFAGLSGVALTNACLAMAGGGAIAVGGAGMAGGVAAIAGGGAILGFTIGGAASVGAATLLWHPAYALTNIAKFELVIKEVFLNVQHDIKYAQECISAYKEQIRKMEDYIEELQRNSKENKEEIKNLKKTLGYMQEAYQELRKFHSSFEEGYQSTNKTGDN